MDPIRIHRDLIASINRFLSEQGFTGEVGRKLLADITPFFLAAQKEVFASHGTIELHSFEKPASLKKKKKKKIYLDLESVDLEQIRAARRLVVAYHRRRREGSLKLQPHEIRRIKAAESLVNAYNRAIRNSKNPSP